MKACPACRPDRPVAPGECEFIERVLASARSKRALDLGCGSGRHARFLAERGWEVVALDASEQVIERAKKPPVPAGIEFLVRDMGAVEGAVRGHFGAALCLGNALCHLLTPESVSRMLVGLRRRLLPGAPLLLELLNYDRIVSGSARALPVDILAGDDGNYVTLGLVQPRDGGIVHHMTSILRHRPTGTPILEVIEAKQIQLRGWRRSELEVMLEVARFSIRSVFGDLSGGVFDVRESEYLIVEAG